MLEVKELHIGYNSALNSNGISGSWKSGEIIVILGDNGVGKSTFLKTLAGLIPPIKGQVNLGSNKIGWVDSSITKGVYLSIENFLSFGVESTQSEKEFLLDKFDLNIDLNRFIDELSDGQFRKLCIIRQLLKKPKILFLDEPTVYLDVKSKSKFAEILKDLSPNCLIFCSTHDLQFADSIKTGLIEF